MDNELQFREYSGSESYISTTVETNRWYHVACTHVNSTGNSKLYLNGNLVSEGTINNNATSSSGSSGIASFKSGSGWDLQDSLDGKISELRIYNRPLTQNEIQYLYSVGKRGLQTTNKKSS